MSEHQLHVCSLLGDTRLTPGEPMLKRPQKKSPPTVGPFPVPIDYPQATSPLSSKCNFCINEPIMRSAVRE